MSKPVQWLTTKANPKSSDKGIDGGTHGWKTHVVFADDSETFTGIGKRPSLCGIRPAHGWDIDLWVDQKCKRCVKILEKITTDNQP